MKAILEFNLDDVEDVTAHYRCIRALDMAIFLSDLLNKYREFSKYREDISEEQFKGIELFWQELLELLQERDLSVNKLIQ